MGILASDRYIAVVTRVKTARGPTGMWNYADIFEQIAKAVPDAPAQRHGERSYTWTQFNERSNALGSALLGAGLTEQSKVAAYLWNAPEYLETYLAAFKVGMVPVNTNYRYGPEEIAYLFDNSDAEAVVFHACFTDLIDGIRDRVGQVKLWLRVADGTEGETPDWAVDYEAVVSAGDRSNVSGPWGRSGDHLLFLYTGGTTGMPKGVMWRQDDLFEVLGRGANPLFGYGSIDSLEQAATRLTGPGPSLIPACPLMHGTGQFSALIVLALGGSVVCLPSRSFSSAELWDTIETDRINAAVIVGDAFAKPMLDELRNGKSRDLSSLVSVSSSGVMWSQETKDGLLQFLPTTALVDSYGSSEGVGLGGSVSTKGNSAKTASFQLGPTVHVFTDANERVEPGSENTGFVAISGFIPVGYYKDPEKSAKTFRTIEGVRYSVPGDYAQVNPDGTLHLLGRGSVCINTGGEKVFPEEVEEVLKLHASVRDAVCVGLPDDRFGEVICAVVEAHPGSEVVGADVIEYVRSRLARYKAPRQVIVIDSIGRSPAGKVDYKRLKAYAQEHQGV